MPGGRPRIYDNVEDLEAAIDGYFALCESENKKASVTGLALALGFCDKKTVYDYAERPEFLHSIKRALLQVESAYENGLWNNSVAGPIFALKNMGWKDKTESDVNHSGTWNVIFEKAEGCEPIKTDEQGSEG